MTSSPRILVIGAGELGLQVLRGLVSHPRHTSGTVAVLLRPASINSSYPAKQEEIKILRGLGLDMVPGDIVKDSEESLASIFVDYDTIIGCTGFVAGQAIISTGMFTSFLFEPSFGVVDLENAVVCALGSLENQVTVTTPEDIGKITAELVLGEESDALFAGRPIFVGGDTVSYEDVARIIESLVQKPVKRNVITVEHALAAPANDPENGLLKYQAVFGQGRGVAWDVDKTWNRQRGMHLTTAKEWATANLM